VSRWLAVAAMLAFGLTVLGVGCWRYEAVVSAPERPCHPVAACTLP
jgi:hypothetical protein